VLLQRGVGAAELERFLADPDPTIGRLAMSAIIASDATRAAAIARRQLEGENQELRVLLSLHQTAQQQDISAVLAALQDVLIQLGESPQDDVASVALRLLRGVETAEDTLLRVAQAGDQSLYSGLERAMELPTENMRPVLLHALTHDLRMVRYAAALALLKLNS
jgi:HEAT repeat protein